MTSRDFCFWLQGFFEISNNTEVTKEQVEIIKGHLGLVFKHEFGAKLEHQPFVPQDQLDPKSQDVAKTMTDLLRSGSGILTRDSKAMIC